MKTCVGCSHALWKRTEKGKLHPSGDGVCNAPYKVPPLPVSMYWFGASEPRPFRSPINRKTEHKDHCTHFQRGEQP